MKYRKLRIAWSAVWGLAAVLLCVLWVRSYWSIDTFYLAQKTRRTEGESHSGQLWVATYDAGQVPVGIRPDNSPPPTFRNDKPIFSIRFRSNGIIYIPHRYLILLTAACGVVPWLSWSNRFSLRTLLIATTLVAVALGLVMWAMR